MNRLDVLGIITARSGSKGLPGKNIKMLAGKPLIAWTIESAIKSSALNKVIVSTDSVEIAEISREYGAEVPFIRPKELAQDDSPHIDVVTHAIEWLMNNENQYPDYIMLLQPTSPLRIAKDIDRSVGIAEKYNADSIISVHKTHDHPYFMRHITESGMLVDFMEKPKGYLPRQLLTPMFYENGAVYLLRRDFFLEYKAWYANKTYPYVMPAERSLQIDNLWEFHLAELILCDKLADSNLL